ncbi:MAG: LamG domain-containing protein [Limisphaerales bacterium]
MKTRLSTLCGFTQPQIILALLLVPLGVRGAATNLVLNVPTASDYVAVPDAPSLDLSNRLTLEAWVNVSVETGTDQVVVAKRRAPDGSGYGLAVYQGRAAFGMNNDTGNGSGINFVLGVDVPPEIQPGTWYHIAATYDGTNATVYVNGVAKEVAAVQMTLLNSTEPLLIGQEGLSASVGGPRPFMGFIDEVRVWNRALSASEIRAGMYSMLTGQEPNLVGYWNFDAGTARDLSPYKNDGFFFGNATTVPGRLPIMQIYTAIELVIPPGLPGGTYQVQYSTNVPSPVWLNLGAPFQTSGTETNFFDSTRAMERRFYRLISQ